MFFSVSYISSLLKQVTIQGLEDQLLNVVIGHEQAKLQHTKEQLIQTMSDNNRCDFHKHGNHSNFNMCDFQFTTLTFYLSNQFVG